MLAPIEGFRTWLIEEGKAAKTVESYSSDIRKFEAYRKDKALNEGQLLTRFLFVRYNQYLQEQGFAISTINKKINSLKVYNDYLQKSGYVSENYISLKKDKIVIANGSEHIVTALSEEEVERFLFFLEDRKKVSYRNRLIGYLLLYTGVRVSELVSIQLDQITMMPPSIQIKGKGGKIREISLRKDVVTCMEEYIHKQRIKSKYSNSPYLLVSQRKEYMHRDAVRSWLASVSEELHIHLHPHLFRHTFATRLLRKGVDITTVSKLTGHANVNMTAKYYIQTSREEKQSAVDKL
ncbi:tyrosine-type recombinase/integrase [Viridibacillus arvi]|uniref:tyrosine-type recombinase/integrase n=1 Tax=Viridibacillus arvi TaxID=263475 RepID=UPI00187B8DD5|nr:tyrosine-type recombinase/integrase [Viridibacillus sp. JNUCC-6]QOV10427.1 tyrosine-type recombinase/integrase [Viridibacillus sp. JNUCC-6]